MTEIFPMMEDSVCVEAKDAFKMYGDWIWQEQELGVRALVHIQDGKITAIRSKHNKPLLHLFPEFQELKFDCVTALLDCNICVFDGSKSIYADGIKKRIKGKASRFTCPAVIVAFDLLILGNSLMVDELFQKRSEELNDLFLCYTTAHFMLADIIDEPEKYWYEVIVPDAREGLIVRDPDGKYHPNAMTRDYLLIKNKKIVDIKIEKADMNVKGAYVLGRGVMAGQEVLCNSQIDGLYSAKVGDIIAVCFTEIQSDGQLIHPYKR